MTCEPCFSGCSCFVDSLFFSPRRIYKTVVVPECLVRWVGCQVYEEVVQQLSTLDDWPLVDRWEAILRETLLGGPEKVRGVNSTSGYNTFIQCHSCFFFLTLKLRPRIDTPCIECSGVLMFYPCSQLTVFLFVPRKTHPARSGRGSTLSCTNAAVCVSCRDPSFSS